MLPKSQQFLRQHRIALSQKQYCSTKSKSECHPGGDVIFNLGFWLNYKKVPQKGAFDLKSENLKIGNWKHSGNYGRWQ